MDRGMFSFPYTFSQRYGRHCITLLETNVSKTPPGCRPRNTWGSSINNSSVAADLVALYEWLPKSTETEWSATTEKEFLLGIQIATTCLLHWIPSQLHLAALL